MGEQRIKLAEELANIKKTNLYKALIIRAVLPILVMGMLIVLFLFNRLWVVMNQEVEDSLKNMSAVLMEMYEMTYPGDYTVETGQDGSVYLFKGGDLINGNFELLDTVKEDTQIDATLYYQDTGVVTTLTDDKGNRLVGVGTHAQILKDVLEAGESHFYSEVYMGNNRFFAYYSPILNQDGTSIGMLFVGKPADVVEDSIKKAVRPIMMIVLFCMIMAAIISAGYGSSMISDIRKICAFLSEIEKGNLEAKMGGKVCMRRDEMGQMGRTVVHMQKSLRELVEKDDLTKLHNRRYAEKRLRQIKERASVNGIPFSVSIGDVDYFKKVNDTYGHEAGDEVLKKIADVLKQNMAGKGFAARWGGEEFLIVFERMSGKTGSVVLQEIVKQVRETVITYEEQNIQVTLTAGIADGSEADSLNTILKEADDKLYQGKQAGRDRVVY